MLQKYFYRVAYYFYSTKACNNGFYGPGCIEKCGYCRDQKDCHNVNGSCLTGCENGYRGYLCTSSKICNKHVINNLSIFLKIKLPKTN